MTARDELRKIVDEVRDDPARRDMSRIIEREYSQARFQGFGDWDQARLVAHHLHAAGYRKPQQVTTVEELNALPVGSVVGDWIGRVYQKDAEEEAPEFPWWTTTGDQRRYPAKLIALPATVLHVGGAE